MAVPICSSGEDLNRGLSSPHERARLAAKLLESLENLSSNENAMLGAEEAERREQAWDADTQIGRAAGDVFPDAGARLK